MRLPLIPDVLAKGKWDMAKLTDVQINDLIHGKEVTNHIADDTDFPMPLMRHYVKELNVPVRRFNMNVAVAKVEVELMSGTGTETRKFEQIFVRDEENGCLTGTSAEYAGISLDDSAIMFLQDDDQINEWMIERGVGVGGPNLHDIFDEDLTREAAKTLTGKTTENYPKDTYLSLITIETWENFLRVWNKTYRQQLLDKDWPERLIEFYGYVFRTNMSQKINTSIIEDELGHWWQPNMFTLKYGMHSIYDAPPGKGFKGMYQILKEKKEAVNLEFACEVTAIRKRGHKAVVEIGGQVKGEYDFVLVTVPVDALKSIEFAGFEFGELIPQPKDLNFEKFDLAKRLFQFEDKSFPFWNNKENNIGGFEMNEKSGFAVISSSDPEGHLSQFRYSNPGFEGNVIMCYEAGRNASDLAHSEDDEVLDAIQEFHTVGVKEKAVCKKVEGKRVYRQPWLGLSWTSVSPMEVDVMQRYCCASESQLYFAGDSWSYCPQWQEGALHTALHAVGRIIDHVVLYKKDDPFQYK